MKKLMRLAFLISALVTTNGAAQNNKTFCQQQVEKKYDKFKNVTVVRLQPQRLYEKASPKEELDLSVEATYQGEQPAQPKEVVLLFASLAEKWRYFEEAEVLFVIDGKRIAAGKAYATDTQPVGRSIKEKLKLVLPIERFEEIVGGKKVEMKLGPTEVQLEEKFLATLRAFRSCLTNQQ